MIILGPPKTQTDNLHEKDKQMYVHYYSAFQYQSEPTTLLTD